MVVVKKCRIRPLHIPKSLSRFLANKIVIHFFCNFTVSLVIKGVQTPSLEDKWLFFWNNAGSLLVKLRVEVVELRDSVFIVRSDKAIFCYRFNISILK